MFAGIFYLLHFIDVEKRYLYSLTFVVITFLFIEINTGLKPFSMTLFIPFFHLYIHFTKR